MITKLNYDTIFCILEFLPNYEIMIIFSVCKEINEIFNIEDIKEYMSYRDHPIVFNKLDNYCGLCNQGIIIYGIEDKDEKLNYIICNHS